MQLFCLAFSNFFFSSKIHILLVFRSISTKSIFAPQYKAAFEEATKVLGTVQTISFSLIPIARHAI